MNLDFVREFSLSFPGTSEIIQWESALLFKVCGKMFVMYSLSEGAQNLMSLKCSPNDYIELVEEEGIIPAPYLARNNWICLQRGNRLKSSQIKKLIEDSYKLVAAGLPKKKREELGI